MLRHRVVVGVDGSAGSARALAWAAWESLRRHAALLVVTAWPAREHGRGVDLEARTAALAGLLDMQRRLITTVRLGLPDDVRPVFCQEVVPGDPVSVLARQAERADLLVVGTDSHGGLGGSSVGGRLAARLGRRGSPTDPCVLVVIPAHMPVGTSTSTGTRRAGTTAVGVDGSDGGDRALAWAIRQAGTFGGAVLAVSAWIWDSADAGAVNPEQTREYTERMLGERIVAALHRNPRVPVTARTVLGLPAETLVATARDADLLVLGSHGHGRLFHTVLGSVADRCVRSATCPVVVVPVPREVPVDQAEAERLEAEAERAEAERAAAGQAGFSGVFY